MLRYVIHACRERTGYVWDHLIPSLQRQGVKLTEIFPYCDSKGKGNLLAFMDCCKIFNSMPEEEICWHMQDDVVICSDFVRLVKEVKPGYDIYCGFCCEAFDEDLTGYIGEVSVEKMWYSFQCIGVKNKYMKECADWFFDEVLPKGLYAEYVRLNKYDDTMFKEFMKIHYPHAKVLNIVPNLVDHVDVLIGGSIINKGLPWRRSIYFEDEKVVQDLIEELK